MTIKRRKVLVGAALGFAAGALPPLAAHAGTLEETKKRGTLRVGVTQAPPWFSKDPKTGDWSTRRRHLHRQGDGRRPRRQVRDRSR